MSGTDDPGATDEAAALPEPIRTALARRDTWAPPPPDLHGDVMAALRRERDATSPPAVNDLNKKRQTQEERKPEHQQHLPTALRRGGWLAAVAACGALLGAGSVLIATREDAADIEVALTATALAPQAAGRAEFRDTPSGFAVELDLLGLPAAPAGNYYQAWLKNNDAELVTIGTFHARQGGNDIVLWSGVDPRDYPTITVTLQEEGLGPTSSGQVVLQGSIG